MTRTGGCSLQNYRRAPETVMIEGKVARYTLAGSYTRHTHSGECHRLPRDHDLILPPNERGRLAKSQQSILMKSFIACHAVIGH